MAEVVPGLDTSHAVETVAHVIQVALTPVFLLSGIGTLLNVFNTRLSRVADHAEHAHELLLTETDTAAQALLRAHMARLRRRRVLLDIAIVLGAVGCVGSCGAIMVLFVGGLRETEIAIWLFLLFGVALGCTAVALIAFVADGVLAWTGLSEEGPLPRSKVG